MHTVFCTARYDCKIVPESLENCSRIVQNRSRIAQNCSKIGPKSPLEAIRTGVGMQDAMQSAFLASQRVQKVKNGATLERKRHFQGLGTCRKPRKLDQIRAQKLSNPLKMVLVLLYLSIDLFSRRPNHKVQSKLKMHWRLKYIACAHSTLRFAPRFLMPSSWKKFPELEF